MKTSVKEEPRTPHAKPGCVSPLALKGKPEDDIVPEVDLESFLNSTTKNIGGPLGLFSEMIINSFDAGAKHVWLTLEGKTTELAVTCLDDGKGAGTNGRKAFLGIGKSASKSDRTKRGRHGLGTKRMRAEFRNCEIVDVAQEEKDGNMRVLSFSFDQWLRKIKGDTSIELRPCAIKRDPISIGLPKKDSTGFRIHLTSSIDRFYTAEQLIGGLADFLPPWHAEKVFISSDGKEFKGLKLREIVGEKIEFTENDPVLGEIIIKIYIPKRPTEGDMFQIGAMGPVCEFKDFRRYLPDRLKSRLPNIFNHPLVNGLIDVSAFNEFSDGDRKSFDVSMFHRPIMDAFINFLERQLADRLEERLESIEEEINDEAQHRIMEEVAALCGVLGGGKTKSPKPQKPLILSAKSLELLTGEKVTISVRRYASSIKQFSWNDSKSGGQVEPNEGKVVVFTAGNKVGEYELVCFDPDDSDVCSSVKISIVPKKQLRISPSQATLEVGESITLRAKNIEDDSSGAANLRWLTDETEGVCKPSRGEHISYTAGYQEGTFIVTVFDRSRPNKKSEAHITVVKEKQKDASSDSDDLITEIEGSKYKLCARSINSPVLSWKIGDKTSKFIEIHINWGHPALVQAQKESKFSSKQILLTRVLLHHIEITSDGSLSIEGIMNLMANLHEKIAQKMLEE